MGFLAVRLNQEYGEELTKELEDALGAVDISHQVVSSQNKFKADMATNNQEWREMEAYRPVADAYASLLEKLEAYGSEYPELTKSIILARDALITLGTAAAGMALLSKVLGKGGGLPWGRSSTTGGAKPTGRPPSGGGSGGLGTLALGALRWAPVAGEAYALYEGSKDDIGNIVDKHDGFTPDAAKEITETGYKKTIKPIVDTALTPFSEAFKSFVNAFGLGDEVPEESTEIIQYHYSEVPVIGEPINREPLLKEQPIPAIPSLTDVAKNPNYQPLIVGGEIMNLVKQNLEQIKQQHNEINSQPTIIELHVTGEMDGRQVMEIVEQHTIDRMNRGSNY